MVETAVLGGGCFWCVEAVMQQLEGVTGVTSGYAGGRVPNPTYRQICNGDTGHIEVVRVTFDPAVIGYREILQVFFATHDPTTWDRQGNDVGPQYRSIILYHDEAQAEAARRTIERLEQEQVWSDPIVTEVVPLRAFYPAEPEHNRYYERNPNQPYCTFVVAPKVAKVRREFFDRLRRA